MENKNKDATKAEIMLGHIENRKATGKNVIDYCKDHGLNRAVYYYWSKRLQPKRKPTFVPVTIKGGHSSGITIWFPNGVSIDFVDNPGVSILKELACCI